MDAAWHPDGKSLALVRFAGDECRVEFPEGTVLARLERGRFGGLRFSPDGSRLALLKHPVNGDDAAFLLLMDPATGKTRELGGLWASTAGGTVWRPNGREIWLSAATQGSTWEILAVDLAGPAGLRLGTGAPRRVLLRGSGGPGGEAGPGGGPGEAAPPGGPRGPGAPTHFRSTGSTSRPESGSPFRGRACRRKKRASGGPASATTGDTSSEARRSTLQSSSSSRG